jgi:transposase
MLACDPQVLAAVWSAAEPLIPQPVDEHPLGCHRRRVDDEIVFKGIVARLITGCSWAVAGWLVGTSESTLLRRWAEWMRAGVFHQLADMALSGFDTMVGLDLSEVCIDTSQHKAPMGGEGTGPSRVDRGKLGWKWSIATEAGGVPVGWIAAAGNVHDVKLVEDTLDVLDARGYEVEIERAYLDRGYDTVAVREMFAEAGIEAHIAHRASPKRGRKARQRRSNPVPLGKRWRVERANSWLSNFGQLRRSTDRRPVQREAALDLAVALVVTVKLVKWQRRHGATIYRSAPAY